MKPSITLVNYADKAFYRSQKINGVTARLFGHFNRILSYRPSDIDPVFFEKNIEVLSQPKGGGFWLWKPYFILKALKTVQEGDFVFYSDSGAFFVKPVLPLIQELEKSKQDIMCFELDERFEYQWTKRDCFLLMDQDHPADVQSLQRMATFSLFKKTKTSMNFVIEWLKYAQDSRVLTDSTSDTNNNYPGFEAHRHDQSIFSLLTKKYQIKAFRDPSQWGNAWVSNHPDSSYDQILVITRKKSTDYGWVYILKTFFKVVVKRLLQWKTY